VIKKAAIVMAQTTEDANAQMMAAAAAALTGLKPRESSNSRNPLI
jgi:hypothetical protein